MLEEPSCNTFAEPRLHQRYETVFANNHAHSLSGLVFLKVTPTPAAKLFKVQATVIRHLGLRRLGKRANVHVRVSAHFNTRYVVHQSLVTSYHLIRWILVSCVAICEPKDVR